MWFKHFAKQLNTLTRYSEWMRHFCIASTANSQFVFPSTNSLHKLFSVSATPNFHTYHKQLHIKWWTSTRLLRLFKANEKQYIYTLAGTLCHGGTVRSDSKLFQNTLQFSQHIMVLCKQSSARESWQEYLELLAGFFTSSYRRTA